MRRWIASLGREARDVSSLPSVISLAAIRKGFVHPERRLLLHIWRGLAIIDAYLRLSPVRVKKLGGRVIQCGYASRNESCFRIPQSTTLNVPSIVKSAHSIVLRGREPLSFVPAKLFPSSFSSMLHGSHLFSTNFSLAFPHPQSG